MPTFVQALDRKTTQLNQKQTSGLALRLIFHCFSLFNGLSQSVSFCSFIKGDYPKILHAVFCPNKY